jgi:3-hydroxy acid dehydrogenase/malonic semialdehyde reductase
MMDLKGKVVVITGASSGFGAACARRFASADAKLILIARREERLEALETELKRDYPGTKIQTLRLDVRDRQAVKKTFTSLPAEFSRVAVLINNAGLALGLEPAHEADLDDWDAMIDTNCKGLVYCTRALLPGMVATNEGHIVNIGSIAGSYAYPGGNVYGATKAFVRQFSLNLRADLVKTCVRVTNIEPGMAETEFSEVRFKGDKSKAKAVYAGMEALTAEDIADTILWCVSRPGQVNINTIELMPTAQAPGPLAIHRK